MRLFLHNCLSICRLNTSAPQTGTAITALQTPRKCSVHNCAPSASGTSQVLRSPFVNNSFHEQGMSSRPFGSGKLTETTKEKICLHCPAKLPAQTGEKRQTTPLRRLSTDRRTCWVSAQNVHLKAGARQRKDVRGSTSSCSLPLCGRSTKTFPHSWMTCLRIDSLSHWTLHDIVFHSARFSAQRQLVPCFTSAAFASDW